MAPRKPLNTERVVVFLTKADYTALQEKAAAEAMTMSNYIRRLIRYSLYQSDKRRGEEC